MYGRLSNIGLAAILVAQWVCVERDENNCKAENQSQCVIWAYVTFLLSKKEVLAA